jgi:ribosomal protein S18 acetylase RimI-like enzyme
VTAELADLSDLSDMDDVHALARKVHELLAGLVAAGAALGWVEPPSLAEVSALMGDVADAARAGDAAIRGAYVDDLLVGLGYWRRYTRPTHWPHADLEKLAVAPAAQGRGVGRSLTRALIADARAARIEVLTLDLRGDNAAAASLYRSLGFEEYGRLQRFVAVGPRRYDKVFLALDLR